LEAVAVKLASACPLLPSVAAIVVLGVASTHSAEGAPSWRSPVLIVSSHTGRAELFAWGDGGATVVWNTFNSPPTGPGTTAFAASRAAAGAPWSTSSLGAITGSYADFAAGANRKGDVVVARWSGNHLILDVRDARSQVWQQQQLTVSRLDTGKSYGGAGYPLLDDPRIAVGPRGDAAIIWDTAVSCDSHCQYRLHAVFRAADSATWGREVEIAPDQNRNLLGQSVAIDAAGNAYAVWLNAPVGATSAPAIRAAFKPAGGGWQTPVDLFTLPLNASPSHPTLAMDARGDAVLAWSEESGGIFVSHRRAGSAWSAPVRFEGDFGQVAALIDDRGDALVSWATDLGTVGHLARYSSASGHWSRPQAVSPSLLPSALAPNGNAVALSAEGSTLQTALKPARSASWSEPIQLTTVTDPETLATVAFDARNHALALLDEPESNVFVYDLGGSGPIITSLITPSRAIAHRRARFSVGAFPWDSPLRGKPRWSFGDGGSAKGTIVSHTYVRPRRYSVSVTARDAAGGVTTASATVLVIARRR
jgi:PKD domain